MRQRFGRRRAAIASLLAFGLIAGACGGDDSSSEGTPGTTGGASGGSTTTAAPATPVAGGSAVVQLFSEIATLDPVKATGSGGSDGQRFFPLYGALLAYDVNSQKMEYILAESFKSTTPDFKTWELKLKPNLKMTDGSPYDAEAVKANWERCKVPANASPARGVCAFMTAIEVKDPVTLSVTNAQGNAHLDKAIARTGLNYIASKKAIDEGANLTQTAVGLGPFKQDEWVRDSRLVMSKNPGWTATPVYLDKLTYQVQSVEQQRIDTFGTGQSDAFYTATPGSMDAATKAVKDSYITKVQVTTGQTFVMNTTKAPFDDVRIRKAVIHAIPIDILAKEILNGSEPAKYFTIPGTPWHSEASALPKFDMVEAQKLIDAYVAEKGGPVKFTMLVFQQQLDQDRGKFIVSQLGKLKNIEATIQVNDSPTNIGKVLAGDYQWSSWGFPAGEPEPGLWNAARSGTPFNYSKYANPEVDTLLDAARVSTDNTLRYANYKKVYEQLAKDVPFFPYVVTQNAFVCSPKLQGCANYEDGILRADKLWKKA